MDPNAAAIAHHLDEEAEGVCERLAAQFALSRPRRPLLAGRVSVGLEIEVPFSSYFPQLWCSWGLDRRRVGELTAAELEAFSEQCRIHEEPLRAHLAATQVCGIPRGGDRYWEFSLDPVNDAGLLWEEIELLSGAGVLPRDRGHALHCTLGGVRRTSDVYYLAMVCEVLFVEPQRLAAGVAATRTTIHTGWGRKGLSGVFEKGQSELKGMATVASELRTLQLPATSEVLLELLAVVRAGSDAIADRQAGRDTLGARWWGAVRQECEAALARRGLPAANWWTGGTDGGIRYEVWARFTSQLHAIAADIRPVVQAGLAGCVPGDGFWAVDRRGCVAVRERASA